MGKNAKKQTEVAARADAAKKPTALFWQWMSGMLLGMLVMSGVFIFNFMRQEPSSAPTAETISPLVDTSQPIDQAAEATVADDAPLDTQYKIVNAHDHLYREKDLPKYMEAAARMGIARTLFVASSEFTFLGEKGKPDNLNDWSTREILKCAEIYPGQIIPFATLHPNQENKAVLLQEYMALGVQGLKLYTGHGNFYERPLDDPSMAEVYAFCEETGLPICWHVNFDKYGPEFEAMVAKYPKLKIIVPHFGLGFYNINGPAMTLMKKLMDTYPNIYADISFGTRDILVAGLERVDKDHVAFRNLFIQYQNRILWGTDMVVTGNKEKTTQWIEDVIYACRGMMEKKQYTTWMAAEGSPYDKKSAEHPDGTLNGMNLPPEVLHKIYETNINNILLPPKK